MIPFHTELGTENENRFEMYRALKAFFGSAFQSEKKKKSDNSKTIQRKRQKRV